ncbi:MAG: long-chain fatty acid--CoA ligase, partial [Betaproteobacteria bacterium]|nr:long-chain fatty acid--CoA ligase [Betaproteobacteria bacterium]
MIDTEMTPKPWPAVSLSEANRMLTASGMPLEIEEREIRGVLLKVWKHAPGNLREVFLQGRKHGSKTFLVHEDERIDFESFSRASIHVAHHLKQLGVSRGDRVALAMRNLPQWPVCFFASLLIGAIVVPLNAWWTGRELHYALEDSGSKLLFVDAERFERIAPWRDKLPSLEHQFLGLDALIGPSQAWQDLSDLPCPDDAIDPDDDATIFYTSGTTGHPKGALGTHRNTINSVWSAAHLAARNFFRRGQTPPPPDPQAAPRANLLSVPFFHVTGCQAILCPALFLGTKIVMMHKWDAERAMQLIERERITGAGGVPTIAWQLLEHPMRHRYDLSSLELVSYGGAPAAAELVRQIRHQWPHALAGTGWGMTETSSTCTHHSAEDYEMHPESCGPALPNCELKVCDDAGQPLPIGTIGELWARGPNVVKGYWNKPQATAETFIDGWVKTGDLATLDEEGFCTIVDRKKDILIRGGENIYCIEVESALYEHPAVMDAAVIGRPHRVLGEEPVAIVHCKAGSSVSEVGLKAWVAERLAAFKVPVLICFEAETLPRNANGKIIKSELR